MNPTAEVRATPPPPVNDVSGPAPMPAPNLVENIPIHSPIPAPGSPDEDTELDKIMQDVGQELRKDDNVRQKHHFWERKPHKKEASFSTQMSLKNMPKPAPAVPARTVSQLPPPAPAVTGGPQNQIRVKPTAQLPSQPKTPHPPKQHHIPLTVTIVTIVITAALIATAYQVYK